MDRKIETDQGIIKTREGILEDEIFEEICDQIKTIEVQIIEVEKFLRKFVIKSKL